MQETREEGAKVASPVEYGGKLPSVPSTLKSL